ncbi:MAG TPA: hypothetical protein PL185_09440 [Flavobacteriales bacterium]|nr:hypothetical protein [Flavobacteriales bacterium]HPH82787.1 hypothetical protein [Flavobacteriales bacterium]
MKNRPFSCRTICLSLLALSLICFSSQANGQEEGITPVKQRTIPFSIRFDGGLGFLTTPRAMKLTFNSVGDANVGTFFHIAKGVNVGLNFRYTGYQVSRNASNFNDLDTIKGANGTTVISVPIHTTHNMFSPGITLGYDKWISGYSLFNFNFCTAYSLVRYANIRSLEKDYPNPPNKSVYNYNALLIEPAVNFMYFFEDHAAMSIKVSYSRLFAGFHPEQIALDGGAISYEKADLGGQIQFISVGLGFVYSFKRIE